MAGQMAEKPPNRAEYEYPTSYEIFVRARTLEGMGLFRQIRICKPKAF